MEIEARRLGEWVDERSLRLGREYVAAGRLSLTRQAGSTLRARVAGSRETPYRVEVTVEAGRVTSAHCSCPVGADGHCKHVAAVLLLWQAHPAEFTPVDAVEASLERRSREELIELVKLMLRREPGLELLVELPLPGGGGDGSRPAATAEAYGRQAKAIFDRWGVGEGDDEDDYEYGYDDYDSYEEGGDLADVAKELLDLISLGDGFVAQRDFAGAVAVYTGVAHETIEQSGEYEDYFGSPLDDVVMECVAGLRRALAAATEAPARESILRALLELFWEDAEGAGSVAEAALLAEARGGERRLVAGWVRAEIAGSPNPPPDPYADDVAGDLLFELERDTLAPEALLRALRVIGRLDELVAALLAARRVDEAFAAIAEAPIGDLTRLLDLAVAAGEAECAVETAAARAKSTPDATLLGWLKARYEAWGNLAGARDVARRLWDQQPSLDGYREVRRLAQATDTWTNVRRELLARLRRDHQDDTLILIHLDEGEIAEAVALVRRQAQRGISYPDRLPQVAAAAETTLPRDAIDLYRGRAEALIGGRNREYYRLAVGLLVKVRAIAERLGEAAEDRAYLAALRERYPRLSALKQELAAVGL